MNILLLTREGYPTVRSAITYCFGKYFREFGAATTLLTHAGGGAEESPWRGGSLALYRPVANRLIRPLHHFLHDVCGIWRHIRDCDVIVLRDKIFTSLFAFCVGRIFGKPVVYWMSYPYPDDDLLRSRLYGTRLGLARMLFVMARGLVTRLVLYSAVLRLADHCLLITEELVDRMAERGISRDKMTAFPMGVDLELVDALPAESPFGEDLRGKAVITYLGALDKARNIRFYLDVFKAVADRVPEAALLLVGDSYEQSDRVELEAYCREIGIADKVSWTGWIPREKALHLVKFSAVGMCCLERGYLFDISSPTKVVEFVSLGVPMVVNGQPDQARIVRESGAGIVTGDTVEEFARAMLEVLEHRDRYVERGRAYIARERDYRVMSGAIVRALESVCRRE